MTKFFRPSHSAQRCTDSCGAYAAQSVGLTHDSNKCNHQFGRCHECRPRLLKLDRRLRSPITTLVYKHGRRLGSRKGRAAHAKPEFIATMSTGSDSKGGVVREPLSGIDVLVIGAGVGGLHAALECWRKGHNGTVFERNSECSPFGRAQN